MKLISDGDICPLLFLLILLVVIGNQFVVRAPDLQDIGLRIAAGFGLLHAVWTFPERGSGTPGEIIPIVLRSLLVGGLLLGPCWIVLSVCSFVCGHYTRLSVQARARRDARRREQERLKEEGRERERRRLADEEWERKRPERELQARLAAEHATAMKRQAESEQTRRENARAACELLYSQHAPEIVDRFNRSDLERFMVTYLTDKHPVEEVERRGQELQRIIHEHRQHIQRDPPESMQGLTEWYVSEKQRIAALPLDDGVKQLHQMQLEYRYAELSEELLQKARP